MRSKLARSKKDAGAKPCAARVCGLLRLDLPFCNSNPQHLDLNKKWRHIGQSPVCLHSSFQSDNLLVEHYELFLHHHVFVVVSEEPVFEPTAFPDFIEKVCQRIPLVQSSAEYILNAAGAAVGYDVVHITTSLVQRCPCGSVFIFAGQFLSPLGAVVDSE